MVSAAVLRVCRAGGRGLEAAVQSTPGRSMTVQLGSAAGTSQPTEQLQVQAGNVQGAMLESSVANKNWVSSASILLSIHNLCPGAH